MNDLTDLATQTLAMLNKQQEYFHCNERQEAERKGRLLSESRRLERALRKRCEAILDPNMPLSLFAGEPRRDSVSSAQGREERLDVAPPQGRSASAESTRVLVPAGADEEDDASSPWWNRH